MSKVFECDRCHKTIKLEYSEKYPDTWVMVKVFSKAQSKGSVGKGYHFCNKCHTEIFLNSNNKCKGVLS
jgi:hypothetical protein